MNDLREIGNEIKIVRGLDREENFNDFFLISWLIPPIRDLAFQKKLKKRSSEMKREKTHDHKPPRLFATL